MGRASGIFFIAKADYQEISRHFPHTVVRMEYAMVTQHKFSFYLGRCPFSQDSSRRKIIRGAISDGYQWVFIILHLNENGKVGGRWITREVPIGSGYDYFERIKNPKPDVVAGILLFWRIGCVIIPSFFSSVGRIHKRVTGTELV